MQATCSSYKSLSTVSIVSGSGLFGLLGEREPVGTSWGHSGDEQASMGSSEVDGQVRKETRTRPATH